MIDYNSVMNYPVAIEVDHLGEAVKNWGKVFKLQLEKVRVEVKKRGDALGSHPVRLRCQQEQVEKNMTFAKLALSRER